MYHGIDNLNTYNISVYETTNIKDINYFVTTF